MTGTLAFLPAPGPQNTFDNCQNLYQQYLQQTKSQSTLTPQALITESPVQRMLVINQSIILLYCSLDKE